MKEIRKSPRHGLFSGFSAEANPSIIVGPSCPETLNEEKKKERRESRKNKTKGAFKHTAPKDLQSVVRDTSDEEPVFCMPGILRCFQNAT